jgi:hypothetical protein
MSMSTITQLPRSALRPLLDRMTDKLPTWKGRLMNRTSRLTLVKITLPAAPIYTAICLKLPSWFHEAMEKIMRAFLWSGTDSLQRGKVPSYTVQSAVVSPSGWPRHSGHQEDELHAKAAIPGRACHSNPSRPWSSMPFKEDAAAMAFFRASTICVAGSGNSILFWTDPWLHGACI